MSIYDDMRGVASNLLSEFQQGLVRYVTWTVPAGATPDNPGEPVPGYTNINAVARPVSTKYVDGSHIVQSDKQVTMPNDGITPTMEGSLEIDGDMYKIVEIKTIPSAGEPITFILIVRR